MSGKARAVVMFRFINKEAPVREAVHEAAAGRVEVREALHTPVFHFSGLDGLPTTVVAFTTDVPTLQESWGTPFLIGPGNIHVAHTAEERISKQELRDAVRIYTSMVKTLLASRREALGNLQ